ELARIFARKPKLVLLDEPSQGINPFVQAEIQEHIKQQNGIGTTFIIVEHNMKFVGDLCGHVVVLNFGHNLSEGTPDEIRADQNVLESYLGRG
ncbi:MAG: ABC transporter ATP-binding protein, partial [Nitrososphaerota archaeon]|nr:ABC transporter ATP-binding protein [Nitrososphaerota archaeon]